MDRPSTPSEQVRIGAIILTLSLLLGCGSSRVLPAVNATWSDSQTVALIDSLGKTGRATLVLYGSAGVIPEAFYVVGDSIHLPGARPNASRFAVLQGVRKDPSISRDRIQEVRHVRSRRSAGGAFKAAGVGSTLGVTSGLLFSLPISVGCNCSAIRSSIQVGAVVGIGVMLTGWAISGEREVVIYRFSPDTPQQLSVVIGVSRPNRPPIETDAATARLSRADGAAPARPQR